MIVIQVTRLRKFTLKHLQKWPEQFELLPVTYLSAGGVSED